jgi:DNA polymerase-3 subunit delta'
VATRKAKEEGKGFPRTDLEHDYVQTFLDACKRDRIPALLFTGPVGVGKELTAIDFARRLCCTRETNCQLDGELCESCHLAVALEHPAIHLVYATPTQGSGEKEGDDEADVGKVLEARRQDLFEPYHFSKKASLRVARARAIIKRANTKPFGAYNVFIIVDAHLMREEAQNALLKVVEEPPSQCAVIFLAHNPDAILYTIRSRCQRVRFSPLKTSVVEALMEDYYGVSTEVARKAATLSQGSIRRAKEVAADHDTNERQTAYELIGRLHEAPESWVIGRALKLARGANRDSIARVLHELAGAYRDIMVGDEKLFINRDQASALKTQMKNWDRRQLPAVLDRIAGTRDDIVRRNLNMDAALTHLFLDIKHLGC